MLSAHYTDCVSGQPLFECYDPKHPTTRSEDKKLKIELIRHISENAKLIIGSEDPVDYLTSYCHYYMAAMEDGAEYGLNQGIWAPLWNLVYHDSIMCYWKEGDTYNRPGFACQYPYEQKFLFDLLCANPSHWNFTTADYQYWRERMKEVYQVLGKLSKALAHEEMTDHQFLTDDFFVQMSKFGGGTEIYVNLRDTDYSIGGLEIPSRGFYVKNSPIGTFKGQLKGPIIEKS